MPMVMMSGRELRRVPLDYQHPTDSQGRNRPIFLEFYEDALERWVAEWREWQAGTHPDLQRDGLAADAKRLLFAEWHGGPPDPETYLTVRWPEDAEMGIQMWETVTEGTPISRVFPDSDDGRRAMAEELASTQGNTILAHFTPDDWLGVISGEVIGTEIGSGAPVEAGSTQAERDARFDEERGSRVG